MTRETLKKANAHLRVIEECDRAIAILGRSKVKLETDIGSVYVYICDEAACDLIDFFKARKSEYERKLEELE